MEENKEQISKQIDADIEEVLTKHNVKIAIDIDFPAYRQLPVEGQLALAVINNLGGQLVMRYINQEQPKEETNT